MAFKKRNSSVASPWQLVLVAFLILGTVITILTIGKQWDDRSDASSQDTPQTGEAVSVWPNPNLIPVGGGQGQFIMPGDHALGLIQGGNLHYQTPIAKYYTIVPVFTPQFTWDTTTTFGVYGWTTAPCTNSGHYRLTRVNDDNGDLRWEMSSTQAVGFGLNELNTDSNPDTFCASDPNHPGTGWNAFRWVGTGTISPGATYAMGVEQYPTSSLPGIWDVALVTVDTGLAAWPPTGAYCNSGCSEQKNVLCVPNNVCDHSKTGKRSEGICVYPECEGNGSCFCNPPTVPSLNKQ